MKQTLTLTITSLFSILLLTFHLADDIARGLEKGGVFRLNGVPILALWLYATLVLTGRRSGYIIIFLLSLLSLAVPIIHTMGRGLSPDGPILRSSGALFFTWTIVALGVTSLFSVVLSAQQLWRSR